MQTIAHTCSYYTEYVYIDIGRWQRGMHKHLKPYKMINVLPQKKKTGFIRYSKNVLLSSFVYSTEYQSRCKIIGRLTQKLKLALLGKMCTVAYGGVWYYTIKYLKKQKQFFLFRVWRMLLLYV